MPNEPAEAGQVERPAIEDFKHDNWYVSSGRARAISLLCDYALSLEAKLASLRSERDEYKKALTSYQNAIQHYREITDKLQAELERLRSAGTFDDGVVGS